MSIPSSRINLCDNPGPSAMVGWATSSSYVLSYDASTYAWPAMVCTRSSSASSSYIWYGRNSGTQGTSTGTPSDLTHGGLMPVSPGQTVYASILMRTTSSNAKGWLLIRWFDSTGTATGVTNVGSPSNFTANTWQTFTATGTAASGTAYFYLENVIQLLTGTTVGGEVGLAAQCYASITNGSYFNGDTTWDPGNFHSYSWEGTPGLSRSTEDYYGVWVEQVSGTGMPRVNVFATGLGGLSSTVTITRTCNGDTWTLPGWRGRSVSNADTTTDWYVPLQISVTYSIQVNGIDLNSMDITVAASSGWVCDPLQPDQAMPINTINNDPSILSLAASALGQFTYDPHGTSEYVMGSNYPIGRAGQRSSASGVTYVLYAHQNDVSDNFKDLVTSAPVLLFKSLPSWGSIPPLGYTIAPVTEAPINRQRIVGNNAVTQWTISGDLVTPTSRPPLTGTATYNDVASAIGSRTYANVVSANANRTYVDVKSDPLSL